jgi:hypothetical protein
VLPDLAEAAAMPLERATSLFTATEHTGYVVGARPPVRSWPRSARLGAVVAGVVVDAVGLRSALGALAGGFALLAVAAILNARTVRSAYEGS